jgi:dipeptidyl aminopeptidase/acylaminoacyl peptidase
VSPIHYVSKDNPPILIMHGAKDALVPFAQSEEFAAALQKSGVDVTLQRFPGANHGGPAFELPAAREMIAKFFDKHLKGTDLKIELLPDSAVTPTPAAPTPAK